MGVDHFHVDLGTAAQQGVIGRGAVMEQTKL